MINNFKEIYNQFKINNCDYIGDERSYFVLYKDGEFYYIESYENKKLKRVGKFNSKTNILLETTDYLYSLNNNYCIELIENNEGTIYQYYNNIDSTEASLSFTTSNNGNILQHEKLNNDYHNIINNLYSEKVTDYNSGLYPSELYGFIINNDNLKQKTHFQFPNWFLMDERKNYIENIDFNKIRDNGKDFIMMPVLLPATGIDRHWSVLFIKKDKTEFKLFDSVAKYIKNENLIVDKTKFYLFKDKNIELLHKNTLQKNNCCGFWTLACCKISNDYQSLEEIQNDCNSGLFQLKVASRVSEMIDMSKKNGKNAIIIENKLNFQEKEKLKNDKKQENFPYQKYQNKDNQYIYILKGNDDSNCVNLSELKKMIIEKSYKEVKEQTKSNFLDIKK